MERGGERRETEGGRDNERGRDAREMGERCERDDRDIYEREGERAR